jgi:hypothetical protein
LAVAPLSAPPQIKELNQLASSKNSDSMVRLLEWFVRSIRNVRDAMPSATAASSSRVVVLIRSAKLRCASILEEICAPNLY